MGREIKFRAWIEESKSMELGLFGLRSDGKSSFNKDAVLMQYTGLKDKKGKEIYEGDIVSGYTTIDNKPVEAKSGKVVTFRNGCFCWGNEPLGWDFDAEEHPCEWPTENWAVVIGNSYENPELLIKN